MKKSVLMVISLMVGLLLFSVGIIAAATLTSETSTATVNLTGTEFYTFSIDVKNVSDNLTVPSQEIGWNGVVAGADLWKVSDQYIEISLDCNYADWGLQIYTDNKGTGAVPTYTGSSDDFGGLVGVTDTATYVPLAFSVKGSTETVVAPDPWPGDEPYANHLWKWMSDHSRTTPVWVDDAPYARVWDNEGIYWHDSPTEPSNPSGGDSPSIVYLSAGFHDSIPQQYTTNKLVLELYSL